MNLNQEERWLLEEKHHSVESEAFQADLKRLHAGEPLAYVIGHAPFLGCRVYLDSKPLIPRPETEYWVEQAVSSIKAKETSVRVLDLCSGSGCIGVAVAKHCPGASVAFSEIDPTHLPTIEKNLTHNLGHSNKKYDFLQSDLFQNVNGKFDFILTNPPYIDPKIDRAEDSVKTHEPYLALYGGNEGLELIFSIIKDSANFLNPNGELWIEHEPEQVEAIQKYGEATGFHVTTHKDQYGVERYSVLNVT